MKFWSKQNMILSMIVMITMLVSLLIVVIPQVFGFTMAVVANDYMEPTYAEGTLLVVKKASEDLLIVGDEVTYYTDQGKQMQTRRIVAIEEDQSLIYTIGDNNQILEQNGIHPSQLIGRPIFGVPYIGYMINHKMILFIKCLYVLFACYVLIATIFVTLHHIKTGSLKMTISY